ncbi:MAG: hypothetical protein J7L82_01470 [Staphylothermus sp.]|nr:hypothetical protein [Staphylothermus sp.]
MVMQPRIKHYDFGEIIIDNKKYVRDLIITPKEIISDWWRQEGHRLQLTDILEHIPEDIGYDAVIIGTGYYGYMKVDKEVINYFKTKNAEVFILDTHNAVKKFNKLVEIGKKVLGLFHLTC